MPPQTILAVAEIARSEDDILGVLVIIFRILLRQTDVYLEGGVLL